MSPDDVIRAVDHSYRQAVLQVLREDQLTYSRLFATVEPEGSGRGRFNYHLKVLREAGLVEVAENLYRLTSRGEAALALLEEVLEARQGPPRWRLSDTIAGSLFGLGVLGLTVLVALLGNVDDPSGLLLPFLLVGSPFLIFLVVLHNFDGVPLSSARGVSYFIRGALIVYLLPAYVLLVHFLTLAFPILAGPPVVETTVYPGGGRSTYTWYWLPWLYLIPIVLVWLSVLSREREWGIWRWFAARTRPA